MEKDPIKQAFAKVKLDIQKLQSQISELNRKLDTLLDSKLDRQTDNQTQPSTRTHPITTQTPHIPTQNTQNPTTTDNTTHIPTDNHPLEAPKQPISPISTGNRGVSTDRQTDRQTDNSTGNEGVKVRINPTFAKVGGDRDSEGISTNQINTQARQPSKIDQLQNVSEIIESLDDIKKDLRHKIKRLTNQEMAVLVSIYQLEEKGLIVDYALLSQSLEITESSIRDYTQRLIKKGIPIDKIKENNKKITLSISQNLKKIAPLQTILQLREL